MNKRLILILIALYLPVVANSESEVVDFSTVLPYAEFSNAIYEEQADIQKILDQRKYKLLAFDSIQSVEVSYALIIDPKENRQIIIIRGTANVENAIADMNIKLISDKKTNIDLHQGFLKTAEPIYQSIISKLDKNGSIVTSGHSLGGAVALILAMQLDSDGFNVEKVVTFGQPKVTNINGAKRFKHLNVIRVVQPKDLVPIVPPASLQDLKKLDVYWHIGKEIVLVKNNEYAELEGIKSMLRSLDFVMAKPNEENLESHKMSGYLKSVFENSQRVNKVEYEAAFNPLMLFRD